MLPLNVPWKLIGEKLSLGKSIVSEREGWACAPVTLTGRGESPLRTRPDPLTTPWGVSTSVKVNPVPPAVTPVQTPDRPTSSPHAVASTTRTAKGNRRIREGRREKGTGVRG